MVDASGFVVEASSVSRAFGSNLVLDDVSVRLGGSTVHALIGPNGAGKTTLLRVLAGLLDPSTGTVNVLGARPADWTIRQQIGWVPPGDRTFYNRLTGMENLVFFARLYGMSRPVAVRSALSMMDAVGLGDSTGKQTGLYSKGMLKRLAIARALLPSPKLLLLDEATHDLDPNGAELVRNLVRGAVEKGATVLWASQLVDELPGFADTVTVLGRSRVVFDGPVKELLSVAVVRKYTVRVDNGFAGDEALRIAKRAIGPMGRVATADGRGIEQLLLELSPTVALGDAIGALSTAGLRVVACTEERSGIQEAFATLTRGEFP